ncbi:MAG TPA: DUF4126 domain-containing protein [Gemmatimonadales bacterium]|nr:DUF4126 domain-containing protein [Gemmatimonadales bacterium]
MIWPTVLSVTAGIGLAAACGFRVFVPLLVMSLAARTGHLPLSDGYAWLASLPALIALGTATVLEVFAYYIPWLDHLLDVLATPVALAAGALAMAASIGEVPPALRWLAVVLGGAGSAGLVQGATVLLRLKSGALTGGLANPVISTLELFGAITTALLALVVPLLCVVLLALLVSGVFRFFRRVAFGHLGQGTG